MASAGVDAIVATDLTINQGRLAPSVVGAASLALFVALILSVALSKQDGAGTKTLASQKTKPNLSTEPSHVELIARLDRLMVEEKVYRDEALSLDKLASALKVQPRQLSTAVNSAAQMSLPQYTNSFRTKEACELLTTSDHSVTTIFYDVGFTSKSNFHREFQRVTGMTPSAYRKQHAGIEVAG